MRRRPRALDLVPVHRQGAGREACSPGRRPWPRCTSRATSSTTRGRGRGRSAGTPSAATTSSGACTPAATTASSRTRASIRRRRSARSRSSTGSPTRRTSRWSSAPIAREAVTAPHPASSLRRRLPEEWRPLIGLYVTEHFGSVVRLEWRDGKLTFIDPEDPTWTLTLAPTDEPDVFTDRAGLPRVGRARPLQAREGGPGRLRPRRRRDDAPPRARPGLTT